MDFSQMSIGVVALGALIFGIVEAFKSFGVKGNANRVVALVVGILITGLYFADQEGVISDTAMVWVRIGMGSLAGGLWAMGFYSFEKRRNGTATALSEDCCEGEKDCCAD